MMLNTECWISILLSIVLSIILMISALIESGFKKLISGGYNNSMNYRGYKKHKQWNKPKVVVQQDDDRVKSIVEHLRTMYAGAHLHSHFSGYVSTKLLLRELEKNKNWTFDGHEVKMTDEECPGTCDVSEVRRAINNAWKLSFEKSVKIIGDLLFGFIKNEKHYAGYLRLIEEQMNLENIDHLELRLKLGSIPSVDICAEVKMLDDFAEGLKSRGKSIIIIPQFSRHSKVEGAMPYFKDVYSCKGACIRGFDIVGNETNGASNSEYELDKIREVIDQSPVLHAGEKNNQKSGDNLKCIASMGITRVGHGLNHQNWKLLQENTVFEYCPVLYQHEGVRIDAKLLENARPRFVIGADDCNKLGDSDLRDNIVALWRAGVGYFRIQMAVLLSIDASFASNEMKKKMFMRWHDSYSTFYKYYIDGLRYDKFGGDSDSESSESDSNSVCCYALDRDLKWYVKCEKGCSMMESLQAVTKKMMLVALQKIDYNIGSCMKGMEIYAYKPNFDADHTWSMDEYSNAGFQYTYIRLKSVQRYTECYNMYESIFGSMSAEKLSGFGKVVSVGGGCGFEILALKDYFKTRGIKCVATIVDIVDTWKDYAEYVGCDSFIKGDINEVGTDVVWNVINASDLLIFSYVFKYLSVLTLDKIKRTNKKMLFNERNLYEVCGRMGLLKVNKCATNISATGSTKLTFSF